MTYIRILHPDFIYVHIAPVLVIILFRAAIRVYSQFCARSPGKVASWRSSFKKFLSFIDPICVKTKDHISWHSERIWTASGHVFYFIMWSAYSAYLVTSFVAKPQEVTISSMKELAENKNLKLGTLNSLSSIISTMQASENTHMRAVWKRLEKLNESEPMTFSSDTSVHAKRILAGNYVYIGGRMMLLNEQYGNILSNHTDIRYYAVNDLMIIYPAFAGIPLDVFYKATLVKLFRSLDENGTLERLRSTHFKIGSSKSLNSGKVNDEHKSVSFKRIGLLLYSAFAGIFLSFVCLILECVFQQRWMR